MRAGAFTRLLERYGRVISVHADGTPAGVTARAFLQPVLERRGEAQQTPTPLGVARREQFLYLGEAGVPLEGTGGFVACGGRRFDIQSAQAVYIGAAISHWWALLTPRDSEGAWV